MEAVFKAIHLETYKIKPGKKIENWTHGNFDMVIHISVLNVQIYINQNINVNVVKIIMRGSLTHNSL